MKRSHAWIVIVLTSILALLDAFFKYTALTRLSSEGRVSVPFDLILHKNEGIAFNIPLPLSIVVVITFLILILLIEYGARWWKEHPERSVAAWVLFIGALGNLVDRLFNGFTTDYLLLFGRSVINISDILIVAGTVLLFLYTGKRTEGRDR